MKRLLALTATTLLLLTGCGQDNVDPNPGKGDDVNVCKGKECGDEKNDGAG